MINLSRMRSELATKGQLEVPAIPLPKGMGESERDYDILTCILSCELNRQSMSDAGCSMLGAGAWG